MFSNFFFYPIAYVMKHLTLLLFVVTVFSLSPARSQTDSSTGLQFRLSANFNSNLNYYGRTDSLKSTGFFPLAEVWFTPEFYINAAPVFVNNAVQRFSYAGTIVTAGYQHVGEKWITALYALKPFYKPGTQLVQSALQAQGGLNLTRLTPVVNLTVGGDVKWSDRLDYGATAGLDHTFRIEGSKGGVVVIDPSFFVYAGTQNFSSTYLKNNPGVPALPGTPGGQTVTEQVQRFNILAYEASVPLIYAKKGWMLLLTPSYILPQNLVTVPNRPDLSERGEPLFYLTAGLKYSF
jgi:hypothetical protein